MNTTLSTPSVNERQIRQAAKPLGRLRLAVLMAFQRILWRVVRNGGQFSKRVFDIVAASVVIVLIAPLMIVIAILIKKDGGTTFFRQRRVGLHGREFEMWKFRSMSVDAEARLAEVMKHNEKEGGVTFKMANDPRITAIGRFIRRASIDELPQLLNVLRGEMSIVGPRPPVPREVALYSVEDRRRFLVKPGLTCLWQIGEREGRIFEVSDRNAIDFPEQVELDVDYIERQDFWQDLRIILKTPPAMLLGK